MEVQKRLKASIGPYLLEDAVEIGEAIEKGAYSSTVRVRWQGTEYRGNKLHDVHLRLEKKKGGEELLGRLRRHCELVFSLNHPNLVQHIGVALSTQDGPAPILITPSLPTNLANIISANTRLPPAVSHSILRDVSQGLAYLHNRPKAPVPHGSLSANNVLLTRGLEAKLSNLGVAAILESGSGGGSKGAAIIAHTKTPEQTCYAPPPEEQPLTTAGDVFSFGILVLHILSGKYPIPTGEGKKEIERRGTYISQIPEKNNLLPLVKECLQNDPSQRPLALTLVERLTRFSSEQPLPFQTSLELLITMERREGELVTMVSQLRAGQEEVEGFGRRLSTYDEQLATIKEQMKKMEEELVGGLEGKTPQAAAVNSLLQPPLELTTSNRSGKNDKESSSGSPILKPTQSVFHWKRASPAPVGMHSASAIVLEGKLYIGGGMTKDLQSDRILYEYDISGMVHKWTALPTCPIAYFSMGVVNKTLVLVGGLEIMTRKTSNKLFMWDRERQEWCNTLPSMNVSRQNPCVASHNLSLIVAGGYRNKQVLADVEVFDQATFQWISFPPLLVPTSCASCCVVRDILYILGGSLYGEGGASNAVQTIPLTGDPSSVGWSLVQNAPLTKSYAVPSSNFLLAVGGAMAGSNTPTRSVYVYFPEMSRWSFLCEMPTAHAKCIAAVLSAGRMIVIGGNEEHAMKVECGTTVELLSV